MQVLAFTNSTYNKTEAVALAKLHRKQDHYSKGTYGEDTPQGWKGCSVGCMSKGKHQDYPVLFGIDARIAYLSDAIFEGLPSPDYKDWTVKLFSSVKEGIDTRLIWYRFTYWMLADAEHGVAKFSKDPAIITVVELFRRASEGVEVSQQEWKAADGDAAYAPSEAARATAYATYVANVAYDTYAARAAYATHDTYAVYAVYAAQTANAIYDTYAAQAANAAYAAYDQTKHYQIMADKLCYFLAGGV